MASEEYIQQMKRIQKTYLRHPERSADLMRRAEKLTLKHQKYLQSLGVTPATAEAVTTELTTFPKGQTFNFVTARYAQLKGDSVNSYYIDFIYPKLTFSISVGLVTKRIGLVFYKDALPNLHYYAIDQFDGNGPLTCQLNKYLDGRPYARVTGFSQTEVDYLIQIGYIEGKNGVYNLTKDAEVYD